MITMQQKNNAEIEKAIKDAQLTQSSRLNLFRKGLQFLPKEIWKMPHITHLNLGENQLSELPDEIGNLTNLTTLFLDNNKLTKIPEAIGNLKKLRYLYLYENNLSEIPEVIGYLKNLLHLYLNNNQLTKLPKTIVNLTRLTNLHLYKNQLTEIPREIEKLKSLKELYLDGNQIRTIPKEIGNLTYLENLDLSENPIINIPLEILNQKAEAVKNYLRTIKDDDIELYEAKLLIVGEGGVGKTSLMKRLIRDEFSSKEGTTEGIEINKWIIETGRTKDFRVNFWDFGGQEIYHATHQFFLTKRSLYLLVWEARKDDDLVSFDYWLNVIKLLSKESPVITVLNKIDERIKMVDELSLKNKFKNISAFFKVSAADGTGTADLKQFIRQEIDSLPHIGDKLPRVWLEIRRKLENLDTNFIGYSQYKEICRDFGLDEKKGNFLSQYFHDLGVFLHFQDNYILKDILFLKPEWATNAVYKLVDTKEIQRKYGKFNYWELKTIWDNYPEDKYIHLLELMKQFELCFQIPDSQDFIVPELLPAHKPGIEWDTRDNLRFEYHYEFMPAGIITRFIVRNHDLIENNIYWKNGVVLKRENSRALIISETINRKISIWCNGDDKKSMLEIARKEIDIIHETLNSPDVKEMVPCNCNECKSSAEPDFYDFSLLKKYKSQDIEEIRCNRSLDNVSVEKLVMGYKRMSIVDAHQKIFTDESNKSDFKETIIKVRPINLFLASSAILKAEREIVELELSRMNTVLMPRGFYLELKIWEKESTAFSIKRKQDEFNDMVVNSDMFICLIYDRVGSFTLEEFNAAYQSFLKNKKPWKIYVYFKNVPIEPTKITKEFQQVLELKEQLKKYEQFHSEYYSLEDLVLKIIKNIEIDIGELEGSTV
jgi:internalin A